MAENWPPSINGREGSPLWANMGSSGFNHGQVPLLIPLNAAPVSNPLLPDTGEADHFLGQNSPPNGTPITGNNDSSVALFAGETGSDSFRVGYGAAPPPKLDAVVDMLAPNASAFHEMPTDTKPAVYTHPAHPPISAVSDTQQYPDTSSYGVANSVPMYNPSNTLPSGPPTAVANIAATPYTPVIHHWYYCKKVANQPSWISFSHLDSMRIEELFVNGEADVVQTDGGRFDVCLSKRERTSVYWNEEPCEIRRCAWFYRDDSTMKHIPFSEDISEELEELYMQTTQHNSWHKRNELETTKDLFVFHSPTVFVQFNRSSFPDDFGAPFSETARPKVVKRGMDDLEPITKGDPVPIDELVFVVHGIGPVCDLKFRNIVECVDDMRATSMSILRSHFQSAVNGAIIGRVEFIPIYWYDALRNDAVGVDGRLSNITLPSVPKIRDLTNEILLDILFYNSPLYSQSILDRVGGELNRLHSIFMERNPGWSGKVSVAGHSLGSLVLFDLLSMQGVSQTTPPQPAAPQSAPTVRTSTPASEVTSERSESATPVDAKMEPIETLETVLEHLTLTNLADKFHAEQIDLESLIMCSEEDLKSIGLPLGPRKKILKFVAEREKKKADQAKVEEQDAVLDVPAMETVNVSGLETVSNHPSWLVETASNTQVGYVTGLQGVGFPLVQYPQLNFSVANFFALGSPISMFLTIRGVETLSRDFQLPTCTSLYNIFHPFDPVAYRIEPLINPHMKQKPVLMPHHKGRKRLHLELKENIAKVSADIKDRVMRSIKSTWSTINDFAKAHTGSGSANQSSIDGQEVDQAIESGGDKLDTSYSELESVSSVAEGEVEVGMLNQGRRIDYVLQEAPFESFNDYLFALGSHLVYWESEDVSLMLMKEIYASLDVYPDVKHKPTGPPKHASKHVFFPDQLSFHPDMIAASNPSQPPMADASYLSQPPTAGASYPNQPHTAGASYPSQPPMAGASYSSQPPMAGASYPSQPPMAGASYSSQPPMAGASYPSQPPMTGASYPSQPPMAGASYPSQPPMTGFGHLHQPPAAGVRSYPSQPPLAKPIYPSQPPMTEATYVYEPPATSAGFRPQAPAPVSQTRQSSGPPPLSGFVSTGPPPKSGFLPRH